MEKPFLFIFSGLPGTGKSTLAKLLANTTRAAYLRIDTIEQIIRDLYSVKVQGEGYQLAYRIAAENLSTGNSVIADSCNPIELTRKEWKAIAFKFDATPIDIEITCSDGIEHRRRVETRKTEVPNLALPTWEQVEKREYHPWSSHRIIIDTANKDAGTSFQELLHKLTVI